jgi:hypothetical protein
MAVGASTSASQLNSWLSSQALQLCSWAFQTEQLSELTTSLGISGLEALGFSSGDATSFISMVSYLSTISGVYQGTVTQASEFDFDNALCEVRGGPAN